jgi:hypothetical protein
MLGKIDFTDRLLNWYDAEARILPLEKPTNSIPGVGFGNDASTNSR